MRTTYRIDLEERVEAPPEIVYSYFVDPERHLAWQGTEAELDPRPGGIYRVRMSQGTWARGQYLELDPPRRVVFTWGWESREDLPPEMARVGAGSTRVEVDLVADGEGTIVRLRHTGFESSVDAMTHRSGWDIFLPRLVRAAEGGDPGAHPFTH